MVDDVVVLRLVDGRLRLESWVHAAVSDAGDVLHVGATGLPPAIRARLHPGHDDAAVARLRGLDPELLHEASGCAVAPTTG